MKTLLSIFVFFCITSFSLAQITITQTIYPTAGSAWVAYEDNRQNVHTITPASGSAQTWNYVNAFVIDDTSAIGFISAASTPYASQFPAATLASYDAANDLTLYFFGNSSGFYVDGFYNGTAPPPLNSVNLNPDMLLLPVPFTYNNVRNNNAKFEVIQAGPPAIKIVLTIVQQYQCDAFGTLSTPIFSNQQVIRIKVLQYTVDSTFVDLFGSGNWTYLSSNPPSDSAVNYVFVRNASLPILMEIFANTANHSVSEGAAYYEAGTVAINEPDVNHDLIAVYPNPAVNGVLKFRIEDNQASELILYDLYGREVYHTSVKGVNSLTVMASHLPAGSYLYKIMDDNRQVLSVGKVIMVK
jgi:hypothetical protein